MNTIKVKKIDIKDADFHLRNAVESDYDLILKDDTIVRDADTNKIVVIFKKHAISKKAAMIGYPALMSTKNGDGLNNRGFFAGEIGKACHSYTAGYMERQGGRNPCCRACSWNRENPKQMKKILPLLEDMDNTFKQCHPEAYHKQKRFIDTIHKDYHLPKTNYTTIQINLSVQGAYHRDKGNAVDGFGCMSVLMKGRVYDWGLCLPEYRVLADLRDRDMIMFDSHLMHGNKKGYGYGKMYEDYNRISIVAYVRERLKQCMSMKQEVIRANNKYGI